MPVPGEEMTTSQRQGLGEGILLRASWPLSWKVSKEGEDPRRYEAENLHLLEVLERLESGTEGEEEREERRELRRLEAKLDLLAEMVSLLLSERHPLPPARDLALGAERILWSLLPDESPPGAGSTLQLSLYPLSRYPRPLRLVARVRGDPSPTAGGTVQIEGTLADGGERLRDALERLVFRAHRREVARLRHATSC